MFMKKQVNTYMNLCVEFKGKLNFFIILLLLFAVF